ncbi:hypothetical protein [Thalassococcus profundi]|uniref:hypothetical protein n=1 Tax=Thalassococcus profundi TaxID=2282382 RepID=UPI0040594CC7
MEKLDQTQTDHPGATSVPLKGCCGGKARADKAPQDATEIREDIESAPAPAKGSSGCCGGAH